METKRPRFVWRALTSVMVTASFVVLMISGVVLFIAPSGRVARETSWHL